MKVTRIVLLLVIIALAVASTRWMVGYRHSSEISSRVFGGREAFKAFRSASDVTAERLHCRYDQGSTSLADYRHDSPMPLTPAQTREIIELFSRRDSYSPSLWTLEPGLVSIKTCGPPSYAVLLTFRSKPAVRLALCFRCDQFGIFVGESDDAHNVNRDDALDFMHPSVIPLIKSLYPGEPDIQAVKP